MIVDSQTNREDVTHAAKLCPPNYYIKKESAMIARKIQHDPILWHDGMMLSAQHFLQMNERFDEMISYEAHIQSPYPWGIKKLTINKELLSQGKFVVSDLEAILPDGLIICNTNNNKIHLELDLTINFNSDTKGVIDIYLYVPPKERGVLSRVGDIQRFNQIMPEIVDETSPYMDDIKIPFLSPNISLIANNETPDNTSSIRLARIKYGNGQYQMTDYIPPSLTVTRDNELWKIISVINQKLRMKSQFLAKQVAPSTIQHDPIILDKRLLLQTINSLIPKLEVLLNSPNISPFNLYLTLANILGNVSSLSFDMVPPNNITYDHNNLRFSFSQMKEMIVQILDEAIGDNYHALPFNQDGRLFKLYVHKQWLNSPIIIGIQPKESKTENEVLHWMLNCIIGNEHEIEKLRRERTLGAQRIKIEKDSTFPPSLDTVFFQIDPLSISPDQDITIFNPSDSEVDMCAEKIHLYIRRRADL